MKKGGTVDLEDAAVLSVELADDEGVLLVMKGRVGSASALLTFICVLSYTRTSHNNQYATLQRNRQTTTLRTRQMPPRKTGKRHVQLPFRALPFDRR
jgi:hypothetical protein